MFKSASTFPTSTLKCLLENTELADLLFKNFPLTDDDDPLKSDKQLLSSELGSKVGWNSSAFLGPNLWEKDQLYSAAGTAGLHSDKTLSTASASSSSSSSSSALLGGGGTSNTTATTTPTISNGTVNCSNSSSSTSGSNGNFKVENIEIDEFLCENNLNLNDIDSFSNQFEHLEQTRSNSPNAHSDPLLLHSPMQAAPAKSPLDDSISRQSSSSSRKYSQDESSTRHAHSRQSKKSRKAAAAAAILAKQFVPDEMKDEKYWARRRKNNLAAKRSRDARRMKENQIALRADFLERESDQLRKQIEDLKRENQKLKMKLIQYESSIKQ